MSMSVEVKYDDIYEALKPLVGIRLSGSIQGKPISKFPLRELAENLKHIRLALEEYRGHRIEAFRLKKDIDMACHFGLEEPDDFCIALVGEEPWNKLVEAANKISKLTNASYTLILSAIIHAIQGIISSEEEEVEEITDPDQVLEELLVWLPEYIKVVE
ncbi:MAG: hypothetical protein GXO09_04265 [Crenarchaeota archaeon]|nr:hypothetical protein [Thermoproteota archaeon]